MRPIDADAIPYTMLYKEDWIKGTGQEKQGAWKEDIDKIPTIEPRRGRWIECSSSDHWKCSECGDRAPMYWSPDRQEYSEWCSSFCPNCGAKMEEEE